MARRTSRQTAASLFVVGLLGGCVDLLHSTDFETLCDRSPDAAACVDGSGGDATLENAPEQSLCAPSHEAAIRDAKRTCALVGACAGPLGASSISACLPAALAAFDCAANASLPARGAARAFWACARAARACSDVSRCVFPGGAQPCTGGAGGAYVACAAGANEATRVRCEGEMRDLPSASESCAALGRRCADALATGPECAAARTSCVAIRCEGSAARICSPEGDRGVDCELYGAGRCVDAEGSVVEPRCAPVDAARACDAPAAITCGTPTKARACVAGREVDFDCGAVGGRCAADATIGSISPALPWSRCVFGDAPCTRERCVGEALGACVGGFEVPVSCKDAGLGPCALRSVGVSPRAACTQP